MDSLGRIEGWQSKQIEELWEKQTRLDSVNLAEIDEITSHFGYPPKEKVGDQTDAIFLVLQHASDATKADFYDLVVAAGKNGDLKMREVAIYQDHVLMRRRVPQEYGSQVWIDFKVDPRTGAKYDSLYLWEVRNAEHVNERRLAAGLDSLATHLRRLGIDPSQGYLIRKSTTK